MRLLSRLDIVASLRSGHVEPGMGWRSPDLYAWPVGRLGGAPWGALGRANPPLRCRPPTGPTPNTTSTTPSLHPPLASSRTPHPLGPSQGPHVFTVDLWVAALSS